MKKIEHKPVNWVNGLKLSSKHFFDQYFSHTEATNRMLGILMTKYSYGLGEPFEGQSEAIELEVVSETISSITLKLKCCNAVTKDGLPILYYEGLYGDNIPMAAITANGGMGYETEYIVYVSVDPDNMIPVGAPDPEVSPLHLPYVLPSVSLHIVSKSQVNNAFYSEKFIPVAEVICDRGTLMLNQNYIPPVQKSGFHDGISTFISQLSRMLRSIKNDIRMIYSRNAADRRREELVKNTFILCEAYLRYFDSSIFWVEEMASEESPVKLIQSVNYLANSLNSALQTIPEAERERLLQYYYDWTNITPSDFLTKIESIISLRYDHNDISKSLLISGEFMSLLNLMFHKMSELEYIGIVRENIIVGDESEYLNEHPKKRSWSFMR